MRNKLKTSALIGCCLLLFYSWLGFLLLPAVGLKIVNQQLEQLVNEPARLSRLEFNPFSLKLDAWQLHIGEQQTLAFDNMHLQLAWDSIWQRKLHLKTFSITEPKVELIIDQLGELNLLKLFNLPESTEPEPEPEQADSQADELPIIQVDLLQIKSGQVAFIDQRPTDGVKINFNELDLKLVNLNTAPDEQGRLHFALEVPDGTRINWSGELLLNPLASYGQLQIADLPLKTWWPYAEEFTDLQLQDGKLAAQVFYQLDLSQSEPQFRLEDSSLWLTSLQLDHQQQPILTLNQFDIADISLDLAAQQVGIGRINSHALATNVSIDQQGQLNWLAAIKAPETQSTTNEQPAEDDAAAFTGTRLDQLDWQFKLGELQLQDYQVSFSDLSRAAPIQLELSQLQLGVKQLDSRSQQPFAVKLDTHIGEQGKLGLAANINPQTLASDAHLSTQNLDLRPAQAFISDFARAKLLSAMLNTELDLELTKLEPLDVRLAGQLDVSQLHVQDSDKNQDLIKWHNLSLGGINLQQSELTKLAIEQITLNQPYVHLIIDEQLQTNLGQLLIEQPEEAAELNQEPKEPGPEPHLQLGKILVENGSAHFADYSLTPHFATALQDLNGEIGTLDNQKNLATPIKINGAVDRQAPVLIEGVLTPFDPMHQLDVTTSFKHLDLTTLTPYSGKFVGYRIHKGKLNLDLHYQIEQGKLNAENSVLLEQLQFGQKVKSEDALQLPVRLAVALLKDNAGNIEIELPVQGDLNNPEFSVMPIVWKTLRNLITRAVSAPFKMLGSLVNSKQDMDRIGFLAGSSELSEDARQSLLSLSSALNQRPMLKLNIEATSGKDFDGLSLAQEHLQLSIKQLWYEDLQRRGKVLPASVDEIELSERQQNKLLTQLYEQLSPEQQAQTLEGNREAKLEIMRQQLLSVYAGDQIRLRLLAQQRAKVIRDFLIEHGNLDAQRIFLLDVNENATASDEEIASLLHLDA